MINDNVLQKATGSRGCRFCFAKRNLMLLSGLNLVNLLEMQSDTVSKELLDQGSLALNGPVLLEDEEREKKVSNKQYGHKAVCTDPVRESAHYSFRTPRNDIGWPERRLFRGFRVLLQFRHFEVSGICRAWKGMATGESGLFP
jgi:hypothetical protein